MDIEAKKMWIKMGNFPEPDEPCQVTDSPDREYNNMWYVFVPRMPRRGSSIEGGYLHNDGIVRDTALLHEPTKQEVVPSGWFKTKKDAQAAIDLYYESLLDNRPDRA